MVLWLVGAFAALQSGIAAAADPEGPLPDVHAESLSRSPIRERVASAAEAIDRFGEQGAVELAAWIGDYVMAGTMRHAVDQHQPADRSPSLPQR